MPTLAAGSVVDIYCPIASSITVTVTSPGRVSVNGRNRDGSPVVPREMYSTGAVSVGAGGVLSLEAIGLSCSYTDPDTGGGGASPTTPDQKTQTAMAGTVMSITAPLETSTISGTTAYSWAVGDPADNTWLVKRITVSGGVPVSITFPSAYAEDQKANITGCTLQPGETTLTFENTAAGWRVYGAPPPNGYTIAGRPSAATAGIGASIVINDPASGLLGVMVSDGTRWTGTLTMVQSAPGIKLPTSTIGTGTSGHLTVGTALQGVYSSGAWCHLQAVASTPAITAGLYWCVFSSTTVGTIYTAGPGSSPFNFSAGGTMTASTAADVNLFVPYRTTPHADGALLPAGLLGPNGAIYVHTEESVNNTAGNKIVKTRLGAAGAVFRQQTLTTAGARGTGRIHADSSEARQVFHGFATGNSSWVEGQTDNQAPQFATQNLALDSRLGIQAQVAVATDYSVLAGAVVTLYCQ